MKVRPKILKEYYYKNLCLTGSTSVVVDGIEYEVHGNKLVVTNIHKISDDGTLIIPDCFTTLDIKDLDITVRDSIKYLDLNNVSHMNAGIFCGCNSLLVVKGNKIKELPESSFSNCKNLNYAEFINVKSLHREAFRFCKNLSTIKMPCLQMVFYSVFEFTGFKEMHFENTNICFYGYPFQYIKELKKVTFNGLRLDYSILKWSSIEYLDIGKFNASRKYLRSCSDFQITYYMQSFNLSKSEAHKLFEEDSLLGQQLYKTTDRSKCYINRVLLELPTSLKEFHYDLSLLDKELQIYYERRFNLLRNIGVKVIRTA